MKLLALASAALAVSASIASAQNFQSETLFMSGDWRVSRNTDDGWQGCFASTVGANGTILSIGFDSELEWQVSLYSEGQNPANRNIPINLTSEVGAIMTVAYDGGAGLTFPLASDDDRETFLSNVAGGNTLAVEVSSNGADIDSFALIGSARAVEALLDCTARL